MIGLYTRIGAALVVAAVLAAGGWKAYSAGKDTVQAEWNAEKLDQSEALRRDEKARTIANQKVDNDYQVEKKRRAADAVVSAGRLRDLQAALNRTTGDTTTTSGADGPYRAIAGQCSAALVRLDEYAQGVAGKARALQDYTREMQLTP